jgi:hypothetical protein
MTVKCILDLTETARDGRVCEFKKGEQYRMNLAGYYVLEKDRAQVVIRKRAKFYKHFMIIG